MLAQCPLVPDLRPMCFTNWHLTALTQVREDYSADGDAWQSFPHEQARSRAYRWGEDGLAGVSDNHQRLCFSVALWNGQDKILKERLFGVTNHEGKKEKREISLEGFAYFFFFVVVVLFVWFS